MSLARIRAILGKELLELRRNYMVTIGMATLPVAFVAMGLFVCWKIAGTPAEQQKDLAQFMAPPALAALGSKRAYLVLMNDTFMYYLLMIPMVLPTLTASYSVVGEKQNRSLEPLLATPIRTAELIWGKALSAMIIPVLLGWLSAGIYIVGINAIAGWEVAAYLLRPLWVLAVLVGSPLLALLTSLVTLIVSARLNDVRAVQAVSASVAVIPFIAMSVVMLFNRVYLGLTQVVVTVALLLVIDLMAVRIATQVFRRESILTRWK